MKNYYESIWKKVLEKNLEMCWTENRKKETMRIIKPFLKKMCLDIGCGTGTITNMLNEIVKTQGIDISEIAIKEAKRKYPHLEFKQGSATDIPFTDNSFNTVFAGEVIEHVPDTLEMFSEFNRVFKLNGNIIIITPQNTRIKNLLVTLFFWKNFSDPFAEHVRFYTKNSLKNTLKEFGFKTIYEKTERQFLFMSKRMLTVAKKIKNIDKMDENIQKILPPNLNFLTN